MSNEKFLTAYQSVPDVEPHCLFTPGDHFALIEQDGKDLSIIDGICVKSSPERFVYASRYHSEALQDLIMEDGCRQISENYPLIRQVYIQHLQGSRNVRGM